VFAKLAATEHRMRNLTGIDEPLALIGCAMTANLFDVFEKQPVLGRSFLPEEMQANAKVVILSHSLWQQAFGGRKDILGQDITLDNDLYHVVGVAHPHMEYRQDLKIRFYVPLALDPPGHRMARSMWVLGRLRPDVSVEKAEMEMKTIAARLETQYPDTNTNWTAIIIPLQELIFGKVQNSVVILFAAAVLILMVACANVAHLLMSRAGVRSQEMAVRSALGAGRARLLRLMLIESMLLSLVAGTLGFIAAVCSMDLLSYGVALLTKSGGLSGIGGAVRITLNPWIVIFAIFVSMFTTVGFGLLPAWQVSQANPVQALCAAGRSASQGRQRRRLSNLLVSAEIAVAFILLVGACLLARSLEHLYLKSPGFNPVNLMVMEVKLPNITEYQNDEQRADFCQSVLDRMREIPGVLGAASTSVHPLSSGNYVDGYSILNQESPTPGDKPIAEYRTVSTDYFSTIGLPLLKGRLFRETDDGSAKVTIVDQEFVQRYFHDKDPIGQKIQKRGSHICEIVGVVGNHQTSPVFDEQTFPHAYEPITQVCMNTVTFMARTQGDPLSLADPLRRAVWAENPNQPISKVQTMQGIMRETMSIHRLSGLILGLFAGSSLLITLFGVYGVITSTVSQRTREIGIRMAFGARQFDVVKSIMRTGLVLTGLGLIAGLAGALVLCRLMDALLYNTSPVDPLSYSVVIVFISVVSLLACYLPARRAAKIDPMKALRYE
jgi:putative ABC transport system permease protein